MIRWQASASINCLKLFLLESYTMLLNDNYRVFRNLHHSQSRASAHPLPCTTPTRECSQLPCILHCGTTLTRERPCTPHRAPLLRESIRALRAVQHSHARASAHFAPLPRESVRALCIVHHSHARRSVHSAPCTTPTRERPCTLPRALPPRESISALRIALRTVHHSHARASMHFATCTIPTQERLCTGSSVQSAKCTIPTQERP
jgi:hypothetical protein